MNAQRRDKNAPPEVGASDGDSGGPGRSFADLQDTTLDRACQLFATDNADGTADALRRAEEAGRLAAAREAAGDLEGRWRWLRQRQLELAKYAEARNGGRP